jgi:hypothetical protein
MLKFFKVKSTAATINDSTININKNFVKNPELAFFFLVLAPFLGELVFLPFLAVAMINLFCCKFKKKTKMKG